MVFEQLLNVEDAVSMDFRGFPEKVFFRQFAWILGRNSDLFDLEL